MTESTGRIAVNAHTTPFLAYDMEGPVQHDMSWLPLSYDERTGQGTYLMRMEPGAVTIAQTIRGWRSSSSSRGICSTRTGRFSARATS
jgi:hypothetical protein